MSSDFASAVEAALARSASLDELVLLLRDHKSRGLTKDEAYDALERLRGPADGSAEDRILELMDIVVGFCAERSRVWEK